MAIHIDLKVEGMDDVIKALREAADKDLRKAVYDVGKRITKEIVEDARAACPVDNSDYEGKTPEYPPGTLREAIRSTNSRKKLTFRVSVPDKRAFYAPFVEYGYRTLARTNVPAQPFLVPAGRKHEAEFEQEMTDVLLKVAKKVVE